ncbi:MAG: hypothetical protein HXS48_15190 [Theionarchaea archaeon]|nr:hypothetical protein [Theionarchaea archaeon]
MNRSLRISVVVIGMAVLTVLASVAMASQQVTDTPLYTYRIEQASSKMNFLVTERNVYSYTAESGYELNYGTIRGWGFICRIDDETSNGKVCQVFGLHDLETRLGPGCTYETCWSNPACWVYD